MANELEPIAQQAGEIELIIRRQLWLGHGCPLSILYGDEGEMQCNALQCRLDFKRAPIGELMTAVIRSLRNRAEAAESQVQALREALEELPRIVPSELSPEEQNNRNGEYVYLDSVLKLVS